MGGQLMSKAFRVNESGELLVNYSANRVGGLQIGQISGADLNECVPLGITGGSPLQNRKHLLMTVTADRVFFGQTGVAFSNGYRVRGAGRGGGNLGLPPAIGEYSNRMQFLRSQYFTLSLLSGVAFCVHLPASIEIANSLEVS